MKKKIDKLRIGFLIPTTYMLEKYQQMIFAPRGLGLALIDGLVDRGHEVFLFSASDVKTKAHLITTELSHKQTKLNKVAGISSDRFKWASFYSHKRNFELDLLTKCYKMATQGELDIIHSYHDTLAHFFDELTSFPTLYTLHDPLPTKKDDLNYWLLNKFSQQKYISISDAQRVNPDYKLNFIETVYHGLNLDKFKFQANPSEYLLFMGRLVPEKGLHNAIRVALETNMQLEIGAEFPDALHETSYFKKQIKPYLDLPIIAEPGIVNNENKILLYKQAKAFLFPIEWEEPFGMVMIEAMACGTPVIAYNRGSVPEIVVDGKTGFIINPPEGEQTDLANSSNLPNLKIKSRGIEGLIEAVNRIGEIDRAACRRHVEENYTVKKMVEGYERVYKKIIQKSK